MSEEELHQEWCYRYHERLGMLCGDKTPTDAQDTIARKEANEIVERLRNEPEIEI